MREYYLNEARKAVWYVFSVDEILGPQDGVRIIYLPSRKAWVIVGGGGVIEFTDPEPAIEHLAACWLADWEAAA